MKSFEELMERFEANALMHSEKNLTSGKRGAVQAYNRCVTRCEEAAKQIDQNYPERRGEFMALLSHDSWDVRRACAHAVLSCIHYSPEDEKRALGILKEYADNEADQCAKMLYQIFFDDWFGEKKKVSTVYMREKEQKK